MPYLETIFDNFNDNSVDAAKWTTVISGFTETSQKLRFVAGSTYPTIAGSQIFDLGKGILAMRMTATGTGGAETEFEFGVRDSADNRVKLFGTPSNATINVTVGGSATASSIVITDTLGVGGGWVANNWVGVGNIGADNIIRFYKSTDGYTWTELARATVGGTFNKTAAGYFISIGRWGGSNAWTYNFDDASYFANATFNQYLIDDFNDNTINTSTWTLPSPNNITESGQKLNMIEGVVDTGAMIETVQTLRNPAEGIFAVKLTKSGVSTTNDYLLLALHDGASHYLNVAVYPGADFVQFYAGGAATQATVGTTILPPNSGSAGPGWVDGSWIGIGNLDSSNWLKLYRSANGTVWTEIGRAQYTLNSFNKSVCGLRFQVGVAGSGVASTWTAVLDDVSFWVVNAANKAKVRIGGVWVSAKTKVRIGGVWVVAKPKARSGGSWISAK